MSELGIFKFFQNFFEENFRKRRLDNLKIAYDEYELEM